MGAIVLEELFKRFMRDYQSFGLRVGCNNAQYTHAYTRWFHAAGLQAGFHVEQEHPLPKIPGERLRRADLLWVRDPDRIDDTAELHWESETHPDLGWRTKDGKRDWQGNGMLTIGILTESRLRPLPYLVAILSMVQNLEVARELVEYAENMLKGTGRRMLLILDFVKPEKTFGVVLGDGEKPIIYWAKALRPLRELSGPGVAARYWDREYQGQTAAIE
jgi:hypothetical protein